MSRTVQAPPGVFDSRPYGSAQIAVIETPFGDAAHVSGQVAWDGDQQIVGIGDVGRQLEKSLENLAVALASAGAGLDDVGALRLDIRHNHIHEGQAISDVLKATFGATPPSTTWIGVSSLARNEFLVEVEPSVVFFARAT
jgi:enamine deaminase RidA (YjgF/YER057c/UK114 family)